MNKISLFALILIAATNSFGAVTITFEQVGDDVLVSTAGSLNMAGLTRVGTSSTAFYPAVYPSFGLIFLGPGEDTVEMFMYAVESPPSNFGAGGFLDAGGGALGEDVLIIDHAIIMINPDYGSGENLSAGAVFVNTTVQGMGIDPGSYVWTLANGETITMVVPTVPEPAAYAALLGAGALACGFFRRLRR